MNTDPDGRLIPELRMSLKVQGLVLHSYHTNTKIAKYYMEVIIYVSSIVTASRLDGQGHCEDRACIIWVAEMSSGLVDQRKTMCAGFSLQILLGGY